MFKKISVNKFDKNIFREKLASIERNIANLEIIRGPHTLGKPLHNANNASVAHQQCVSIDAFGRFSV